MLKMMNNNNNKQDRLTKNQKQGANKDMLPLLKKENQHDLSINKEIKMQKILLTGILASDLPSELIADLARHGITYTSFLSEELRLVYAEMCNTVDTLVQSGYTGPIDRELLASNLEVSIPTLIDMFVVRFTTSEFEHAKAQCIKKSIVRKALNVLQDGSDALLELLNEGGINDTYELLMSTSSKIDKCVEDTQMSSVSVLTNENIIEVAEEYDEWRKSGVKQFHPTGFEYLDNKIKGWRKGYISIILGRAGSWKTSFALNMFFKQIQLGTNPTFISLEMDRHDVLTSLECIAAGVDKTKWLTFNVTEEEFNRIKKVRQYLAQNTKFSIVVFPGSATMSELKAQMSKSADAGSKVVFVDYLQEIKDESGREKTLYMQSHSNDVRRHVSLIAKKHPDFAAVFCAQASRASEKTSGPLESNIPEARDCEFSSSIEQDATLIISLMLTNRFINENETEFDRKEVRNQLWIKFPKNRAGDSGGRINLHVKPEIGVIGGIAPFSPGVMIKDDPKSKFK